VGDTFGKAAERPSRRMRPPSAPRMPAGSTTESRKNAGAWPFRGVAKCIGAAVVWGVSTRRRTRDATAGSVGIVGRAPPRGVRSRPNPDFVSLFGIGAEI